MLLFSQNDLVRSNYLLAQAHVDAPALANSIAHLNTVATFTPLQALQDTDVAGYLRHAHEQNLISTIEEARKETQEDFYRLLEDRERRDWEAKKKRMFEELGERVGVENRAVSELKKSMGGKNILAVSTHSTLSRSFVSHCSQASTGPAPSLHVQSKMMAYDRVITELNAARLRVTSYPIVHALIEASLALNTSVGGLNTCDLFSADVGS